MTPESESTVTLEPLSTPTPNLAPLFRRFEENRLVAVEMTVKYRWSFRPEEDSILTRAEVLRLSADKAKAFTFPIEKHGDRVYVDLRRLDPGHPDAILVIDAAFLADLKRLKLHLKDGRLYTRTQRQDISGRWNAHLTPVISIVAAWKYGEQWDVTFLSAKVKNGDSLDLRSANVRIPALEESPNTERMNLNFNKGVYNAGWRDGRLADKDTMQARPVRTTGLKHFSRGAGPDSDEDDVGMMTPKWHTPATDGQRTEGDSATSENLFLSEREMEQVPEQDGTKTSADLYVP
jgi:hypothetical protein